MGARQLVALGLRLFAVWICLSALQFYLIMSSIGVLGAGWLRSPWMGVLVTGIAIALSLVVWALSGPMARGLMSGLHTQRESRFSPHQAVEVGCILMGLWWLKAAILPLATLWFKALSMSAEQGRSALAWLGVDGKSALMADLLQICIGLLFVTRPQSIAQWLLRHVPVVPAPPMEKLNVILRRMTELGLRQTVRPQLVDDLVHQVASHSAALDHFNELEELLEYEANPHTRSAAARAIVALGSAATLRARAAAEIRLTKEAIPEVANDLRRLIQSSASSPSSTK